MSVAAKETSVAAKEMSVAAEERIRERAHAIWIEEGCPEGRDQEHWLRAEQEVSVTAKAPARKATVRKPSTKAAAAAPQPAARKPRARKAAVTA